MHHPPVAAADGQMIAWVPSHAPGGSKGSARAESHELFGKTGCERPTVEAVATPHNRRHRRNCDLPVTIQRGTTQVAVDEPTSGCVGNQPHGPELVRVRAHDDGARLHRSRRALQGHGLHLFLCDGFVDLRGPGRGAVRAGRAPGRRPAPDRSAAEPVRALFELRPAGGCRVRSAVAVAVRQVARGVPDPDRDAPTLRASGWSGGSARRSVHTGRSWPSWPPARPRSSR